MPKNRALVLFSGGQDSTTVLGWALDNYTHVETVGFTYAQRHGVELECRKKILKELPKLSPTWKAALGPDHVFDLTDVANISKTAMTSEMEFATSNKGLLNTYVPGRNLFFFLTAAALAHRQCLFHLIGGMSEQDSSGYPDCTDDAIKAMQVAINLGMDGEISIETPLMHFDKAETFAYAKKIGGTPFLNLVIEESHTCYTGDRSHRHIWGYGCDNCPACAIRAYGYRKFAEQRHESNIPA